jgi:murein DD-endopeptidase MepM/ murein hydrolase activator NlpD
MRKPFDGDYPITQTYAEHVQRRIDNGWQYYNGGIDYAMPERTPVLAAADGLVRRMERLNAGYGNVLRIEHGDGELETLYAHLSYIVVSVGQAVTAGQMIGRSGNTGKSTGPHLHFELRKDGKAVDPQPYLDGQLIEKTEQLEPKVGDYATLISGYNLRTSPMQSDNLICTLQNGITAQIMEVAGDWLGIKLYIHKDAKL